MNARPPLKQARLVAVAWGEPYLAELLDIALPAVLAPGNLPALAEELPCEFALVTEQRLFDRVRKHPVYERMQRHCKVKLLPVDDLIVAPLYGLALTYALYRGFEDLGETVTETALLFINSDWILADGSYRSVAKALRNGARLINAPSYCVVSERIEPDLRARLTQRQDALSIPHREMAGLAIRHRHNPIRGKTLNRKLFHMNVIDQFYWLVDDATMLCHQMPIAVVCLVPESVPSAPRCFWDYGITLELCPTTTPVVLADSDDFLMIELRSEQTYSEGLRLGWPPVEHISRQLGTFVTKDHIAFASHQLCLHAGELPRGIQEARGALAAEVRAVLAGITEPKSYKEHAYWRPQHALFESVRRDFANREIVSKWQWGFRASPYTAILLSEIDRIEQAAVARGADNLSAELAPLTSSIGQLEGLFAADVHALRKTIRERGQRWHALRPLRGAPGDVRPATGALHALHPDRASAAGLLEHLVRRPAGETLAISSSGRDLALRALRASKIEPRIVAIEAVQAAVQPPCALVVLDLDHNDLALFRTLCRKLLPAVQDGGAIVLLHENRRGPLQLHPWTLLNVLAPSDSVALHYTGSRWSHLATGIYDRLARRWSSSVALVAAAPFALVATLEAKGQAALPPSCASMLLTLPVNPTVRSELERW